MRLATCLLARARCLAAVPSRFGRLSGPGRHARAASIVRCVGICVLLLVCASPIVAQEALPTYQNGTVTRISDGDTIDVKTGSGTVRIRLFGIDCPESDQPFGMRAKHFVEGTLEGETVTARVYEKDRYGRYVSEVYVDGVSLNRELVRHGLAWWYKQFARHDLDLKRLESRARAARIGLWIEEQPIPPWRWRQLQREEADESDAAMLPPAPGIEPDPALQAGEFVGALPSTSLPGAVIGLFFGLEAPPPR